MSVGGCFGHILIFLLATIIFGPVGGLVYLSLIVAMFWLAFK